MLWKLIKILSDHQVARCFLATYQVWIKRSQVCVSARLKQMSFSPLSQWQQLPQLEVVGLTQRFSFSLSLRQREPTWHPPVRCIKQCLLVTSLFEQLELDMGPLEMFPEVTKMTGAGDPLFYLKLVVSCLQFSILSSCRVGMPGVWAQTFHSLRQSSAVSKHFPTLVIQWLLWNCYTYLKVRRLSLK